MTGVQRGLAECQPAWGSKVSWDMELGALRLASYFPGVQMASSQILHSSDITEYWSLGALLQGDHAECHGYTVP